MNALRKNVLCVVVTAFALVALGAETKDASDATETKDVKPAKEMAKKPAGLPTAPLSPRFKQVRDKITTLFEHRNEPPPAPDPRANPFRPPGSPVAAAPIAPAGDGLPPLAAEPEPPSTDLTRLQEGVATLKFGGTLERGGNLYLMINGRPYTDHEVVQAQAQGETVYLRLKQISRRSVTVFLNEAEMTLKF